MSLALAADLCVLAALGSLAALWQHDRTEPLCRELVIALAGVGLVVALF
ncbi:hypothetical protein [Rhodovulum strictum]|uniref:Uncharacterized protein n=1 Tax=Rhodovulum strictum TaxID=58314 RepID=A0A844B4L6_9RHOB|nr:hypothetical protein [Rhodovulum strictum]MRH21121.1 hypothetical protein [Rhodovulum strictum]